MRITGIQARVIRSVRRPQDVLELHPDSLTGETIAYVVSSITGYTRHRVRENGKHAHGIAPFHGYCTACHAHDRV